MIKVLYIFAGANRTELEKEVKEGRWPDNWFFGYRQVEKYPGIRAEYVQVKRENSTRNLWLFFSLYSRLRNADVIFITSSAHLALMRARKFGLLRRQKWIILNLDLTHKLKQSPGFIDVVKEADLILCPSRVQGLYLEERGIKKSSIMFLPFGVDAEFYHPLPEAEQGIVLAVGRDVGRDYGTLIEAVRGLDVPAVIMCRPKNIANTRIPIPPNVKIIDEKTPLETREYYARTSVSIIPSRAEEATEGSDCSGQTVILESMGYCKPVVATRKEWFKDYFIEGVHLLVVPPGNPEALRQTIEKIYQDKDLRKNLIREGRKLVEEKYNSGAMGKAIAEIILEVVSKDRRQKA